MIVIENLDLLISLSSLSPLEREDLPAWFAARENKGILDMGGGRYLTAELLSAGQEPMDIRVEYNPDMFMKSYTVVPSTGYAVAVDKEECPVCVLAWQPSTYYHNYTYTGTLDLRILAGFDCLFLFDCNEFGVELCLTALRFWKGRRLVLVGKNWEGLLPSLPDLPDLECFYEEVLSEERLALLSDGMRCLNVTAGIPHYESLDRFDKHHILLYDELMAFVFLFADQKCLGEKNPDRKFLVINAAYDNFGIFAILRTAAFVMCYAKYSGYVPIMRLTCGGQSYYQNSPDDDIWAKFFHQPEGFTLQEALESKQTAFTPLFYNAEVMSRLMERSYGATKLAWPDGIYNEKMTAYFQAREKKFLPCPERTLGVLARGTDYVNTKLWNHAIHADLKTMCAKIDEVWTTWGGFDAIYLATEDASYCEYFRRRYGNRVTFTDQERYTITPGERLADMHRNRTEKRDGFLLGAEYALSIRLLARCRSLLASGECNGEMEARRQNDGRYEHVFIFDLGRNRDGGEKT